ncbi:MAG: DUF4097 domain-containing protein, partial [Chloroflexota bacterium]|nr:DUF4097 domain-containing protein [Chloroflexota bacterium]
MIEQTFSLGRNPRIHIAQVQGNVEIQSWREHLVSVVSDGEVGVLQPEGKTLNIQQCSTNLKLQVPVHSSILIKHVEGNVFIERVDEVHIDDVSGQVNVNTVGGDAHLEHVGGAIELGTVGSDLHVEDAPALAVHNNIGADAIFRSVGRIAVQTVGADCAITDAETVEVSTVGNDLSARNVQATLRCGVVGNECSLQGCTQAEITLGNIGSDIHVSSAASLQAGTIGSDCSVLDIAGDVTLGQIGSDLHIQGIGGNLRIGSVGGDARLQGIQGAVDARTVGGDLDMQSTFSENSRTHMNVGGDARLHLPDDVNLSIRALVGGDVRGEAITFGHGGHILQIIYGDGNAHLDLKVGGDLTLHGNNIPSNVSGINRDFMSGFSQEMGSFGRDMGKFGRDMGRLGQELAEALNPINWSQDVEAEKYRRKAEKQARKSEKYGPRVRVRVNEREWQFDPDRVERLKDQARQAAAEGVYGALEAVERAMHN